MRQRLGIAGALLGDPGVLVSSHLMSEMQLIADRVIVIGRGRLIADTDIGDLLNGVGGPRLRVRTPQADELVRVLPAHGSAERTGVDELEVVGVSAPELGDLAHAHGVRVHHLADVEQSLEHAYLSLTDGATL